MAKKTLNLDKTNWKDWTKLNVARKKFRDLTREQQLCISQVLECSATAWNRRECGPQTLRRKDNGRTRRDGISNKKTKSKIGSRLSVEKAMIVPPPGAGDVAKKLVHDRYRMQL